MSSQRRLVNGTILADGKVLATGGSAVWNELTDVNNSAEIWDPHTGTWTVGASGDRARLYHSIAMLLPDASVLVGGGGAPGPQNNTNVEIYYPPYLFDAGGALRRAPGHRSRPAGDRHRPDLRRRHRQRRRRSAGWCWSRRGSVTHSCNMEQRFIELTFTAQRQPR